MAYIPAYFFGHFQHDGCFSSITIDEGTGLAFPTVCRQLDEDTIHQSAINFCNGDLDRVNKWKIFSINGLFKFEEFQDALATPWLIDLTIKQNIDVIEAGTMRVMHIIGNSLA